MPGKDDNARKAHIDNMNALLADYFALYVKTKNFHWHVAGPQFHDLHLLFDTHAQELFALTDIIAERVRKNGAKTLTSLGAIKDRARIADEDRADLSAQAMIRQLRDDNVKLIKGIRSAKDSAGQVGDNATDGMSDDWTDEAEQRVWFLSQLLEG
ncbi:Dps family protein [Parablastomonas sp. CN1-191]|uniref:Dps family protein n=1 Tax=Parablastomonas sp. CN1-191 TaxID=3400908 RepID=UPI003BF774AC